MMSTHVNVNLLEETDLPEGEKVSQEMAETEFARWGRAMDLDFAKEGMDDEDLKGFQGHKRVILTAMRRGTLVVNDEGFLLFTTKAGKLIKFHEPTGASLMAMDQKRSSHHTTQMFAVIADFTKTSIAFLQSLKGFDLKVVQAIAGLFLA